MQGKKKIKPNEQLIVVIPKNINVNLLNNNSKSLGVFQLPITTGPQQFQQLVNSILPQEDRGQFNFYLQTKKIRINLQILFQQINFTNFETNLDIVYHPVSNLNKKSIKNSSSSMCGHTQAVLSVSFSPDCKKLATGSADGTVRLWDFFTQTLLTEIVTNNWVLIVQWSPDAQKLAFAQKSGKILIYTSNTQKIVSLSGHSKWVTSLAWIPLHISKSCNRIVSSSDNTIRIWNTDSGLCFRQFGTHTKCVTKVLWSGRGEIYSCSEDQRICCFNNDGNYLRELKKHDHQVNTMSLSTDAVIKRGCFESGKEFQGTDKHSKALELYKKAIQYHGQRLVTGSKDFTMMLFELPNKVPIKQMVGHGKPINHVVFSPNGRYIVSGSFDKNIKLWDGYTGEFISNFDGHVGPVYLMSWSVDSQYFISAGQDSTLKLWDIKTRKLLMDLIGHSDQIFALDFAVDGKLLVSGGKNRQVRLWEI